VSEDGETQGNIQLAVERILDALDRRGVFRHDWRQFPDRTKADVRLELWAVLEELLGEEES